MGRAVRALATAVRARRAHAARLVALDAATSGLDLRLRHRPPAEIDRGRFGLRLRRIEADAAAGDRDAVRAGAATLGWIRDRIAHSLPSADRRRLDARLRYLEAAATAGELERAADAAGRMGTASGRR